MTCCGHTLRVLQTVTCCGRTVRVLQTVTCCGRTLRVLQTVTCFGRTLRVLQTVTCCGRTVPGVLWCGHSQSKTHKPSVHTVCLENGRSQTAPHSWLSQTVHTVCLESSRSQTAPHSWPTFTNSSHKISFFLMPFLLVTKQQSKHRQPTQFTLSCFLFFYTLQSYSSVHTGLTSLKLNGQELVQKTQPSAGYLSNTTVTFKSEQDHWSWCQTKTEKFNDSQYFNFLQGWIKSIVIVVTIKQSLTDFISQNLSDSLSCEPNPSTTSHYNLHEIRIHQQKTK